jgi:hypothetical protein
MVYGKVITGQASFQALKAPCIVLILVDSFFGYPQQDKIAVF